MTVSQQYVRVVAVLAALAFLGALLLVHLSSFHDVQGAKPVDPDDPESATESVTVEVECTSAASGPVDVAGDSSDDDAVREDDTFTLGQEGVDVDEVAAVCGRTRTERVTHAGELAVLGLLLTGSAVLERRNRRHDEERRALPPRPSRQEREDGVL